MLLCRTCADPKKVKTYILAEGGTLRIGVCQKCETPGCVSSDFIEAPELEMIELPESYQQMMRVVSTPES